MAFVKGFCSGSKALMAAVFRGYATTKSSKKGVFAVLASERGFSTTGLNSSSGTIKEDECNFGFKCSVDGKGFDLSKPTRSWRNRKKGPTEELYERVYRLRTGRDPSLLEGEPMSRFLIMFIELPRCTREYAVEQVWKYIKEKKLQNPNDESEIRVDPILHTIFGSKKIVKDVEVRGLVERHFNINNPAFSPKLEEVP